MTTEIDVHYPFHREVVTFKPLELNYLEQLQTQI